MRAWVTETKCCFRDGSGLHEPGGAWGLARVWRWTDYATLILRGLTASAFGRVSVRTP
jgi:hypothetical protein